MIRIHRIALLALLAPPMVKAANDRILDPIDDGRMAVVRGNIHPQANSPADLGPADPSLQIGYVTLLMRPLPSLDQFLAEQQTPSSPNYRRWITPEQFADRFGLSRNDMDQVVSWLRSHGLQVDDVARGRHWVTFSGTAAAIGRAFRTEIHRYLAGGRPHYANATEPSVPAALADVVAGFNGLNDFGMQPLSIAAINADPESNINGSHYLAPDDIATIYDVAPLYNTGINGAGQTIAVVGQTAIDLADIRAFRKAYNLPPSDPQLLLVGTDPGIVVSQLAEADIDIEWSGAVARNATIIFVYSQSVDLSAQYAIDQNLAPVISESYGACERFATPAERYLAQQANAQGITWIASSGDQGATTCDRHDPTPQAAKGATVTFPASIPEITAVGGSEFNEGSLIYWAAGNSPNSASALSYIPEKAWNDTVLRNSLSASGGGPSALFAKPAWQAGPGVPSDNARDVPDVALSASADHDGYLVYTGGSLSVYGGTSVAAPEFAGIVALLNQQLALKGVLPQPGLGNINPVLYHLAQATSGIFHDITSGDNMSPCEQASPGCVNGLVGFSAGPGYDLVTGLGSVDAYNLVSQWTTVTSTTTTVTSSLGTAALSDTVQLTATVTGGLGTTPTGTVNFLANDNLLGTVNLTPSGRNTIAVLSLSGTQLAASNGTVTAVYSGDTVFNGSSGSITVRINLPESGSAVVPLLRPTPVYQQTTAGGVAWYFTLSLTEKAGVSTTLTGFSVGAADETSQIVNFFGTSLIPAGGTISANLVLAGITPPVNRVFAFSGVDAGGRAWSQQVTVPFLGPAGPALFPSMTLFSTPATMVQNPQADPSCQWSNDLVLQENNGFSIALTKFTVAGTDVTGQIQPFFGTTRLAPFRTLQAPLCWPTAASTGTKNLQLTGTDETGDTVTASLVLTFAVPSTAPVPFAVAPAAVNISAAGSGGGGAALALSFTGGSPRWTISVLPSNGTANWLTVTPISGTGPGQVNVTASGAGLSSGVYQALLGIQSPDAIPQYINVPVTFVVGASSTASIGGVINNFSGSTAAAPGMMMAVYGTQLAPPATSLLAAGLPLPLTLAGVSATVNGITAPLYFVSPGQLDVQVPYEAGSGPAVLAVNNNGQVAAFPFSIQVSAPGIATPYPASASQGQVFVIYITGEGDVTPTLATGATPAAGTDVSKLPQPRQPVAVTVGGVSAAVAFAGIPTGLAGVTQVNFTVPPNAPLGPQKVVVTVGGVSSQAAALTITAGQN